MYVGSSQSRAVLRQYEFFFPKKVKLKGRKGKKKRVASTESKQDRIKFDVLLTSYEMINLDTTILKALKWECLVRILGREILLHNYLLSSVPSTIIFDSSLPVGLGVCFLIRCCFLVLCFSHRQLMRDIGLKIRTPSSSRPCKLSPHATECFSRVPHCRCLFSLNFQSPETCQSEQGKLFTDFS